MSGSDSHSNGDYMIKFHFPSYVEQKPLTLGWILDNYLRGSSLKLKVKDQAFIGIYDLFTRHERYLKLESATASVQVVVAADDLSGSQYFTALMNSQMVETTVRQIQLKDVEFIDFLHILDHHVNILDLDKCKLCSIMDNPFVFSLVDTAMYLHYEEVLTSAVQQLCTNLSKRLAIKCCMYAAMYGLDELLAPSLRHCLHYIDFIAKEHLQDLVLLSTRSPDLLLYVLNHPLLNINSPDTEEKVKPLLRDMRGREEEDRGDHCTQLVRLPQPFIT